MMFIMMALVGIAAIAAPAQVSSERLHPNELDESLHSERPRALESPRDISALRSRSNEYIESNLNEPLGNANRYPEIQRILAQPVDVSTEAVNVALINAVIRRDFYSVHLLLTHRVRPSRNAVAKALELAIPQTGNILTVIVLIQCDVKPSPDRFDRIIDALIEYNKPNLMRDLIELNPNLFAKALRDNADWADRMFASVPKSNLLVFLRHFYALRLRPSRASVDAMVLLAAVDPSPESLMVLFCNGTFDASVSAIDSALMLAVKKRLHQNIDVLLAANPSIDGMKRAEKLAFGLNSNDIVRQIQSHRRQSRWHQLREILKRCAK